MVSDSLEWAHRFNSHHIRIPICSNFSFPQTRTGQNTEHGNVAIRTKRFSIRQNSFPTYFRSSFTFVSCGAISWEPKSQTSPYLFNNRPREIILSYFKPTWKYQGKEPLMLRPQFLLLAFLVHPEPGRVCGYIILWLTDDCTYHFNVLHLRRI